MAAAHNLPAEVMHPARPGCMLTPKQGDAPINFRCDGCMEPGEDTGTRYTSVNNPRVHLHTHCALATPTLQHQLVNGTLELRHEAPAGGAAVVCDACYGAVQGFHYHCSTRNLDLHPGCARMPLSITLQGGTTFELRTEVSHRCTFCMEMEWYYRPWCYRSTNLDHRVYLHINCIKEIMAGFGSRGGGGGGGGGGSGNNDIVIARLQQRAGGSSKLVGRICEVLVIFMRVVIGVLFGDPTALLVAGVNLIPALLNQ